MAHIARTHNAGFLFRCKHSAPRSLRRTAGRTHHSGHLNPIRCRRGDPSVPTPGKPQPRLPSGGQLNTVAARPIPPIRRGGLPPRVQTIPLPHHPYRHPLDRLEPVGTRSTARTGRPRLGTRHRAPLHRPSHASPPLPRQTRSRIGQRNPRLWKHPTWNNPPLLTPQ